MYRENKPLTGTPKRFGPVSGGVNATAILEIRPKHTHLYIATGDDAVVATRKDRFLPPDICTYVHVGRGAYVSVLTTGGGAEVSIRECG